MGKIHPGFRNQLADPKGNLVNICHPVINVINLSSSPKLSSDCLANGLLVILHNISLNRHTVHRRLLQHAHVTDSDHAHMEGSGNRRCSQGKHINILFQLLDLLLMGNAETLLLINDQKPQIPVLHILGKHSVGTDHNVHLALFQILDGLFLLGRSSETAEKIHSHRELLHSLDKCVVNLLGQNGGRHKIHNLSALLHFLKGSAKGNLRFAIANVTANQTVHDLGAFHIPLGILNGIQLILGFLIREHFLKLTLPYGIRSAYISLFFLAHRIKLHQLFGDIFDRALYL